VKEIARSSIKSCSYSALLTVVILTLAPARSAGASLEPSTVTAWEGYIHAANMRMEQRLSSGGTFLWAEESKDRLSKIRAGEIVVAPAAAQSPKRVPSGLIHDWIGTVFIPNVTLREVLQVVSDYGRYKDWYPPNVVESKALGSTLDTDGKKDRFSMRLKSTSFFLKSTLETDYESWYVPVDNRRGYSITRTTRVQEIQDYGTAAQHALPEGQGTGIAWRLYSITRYAERDGGVFLEREAMGLSRDIPASLRWVIEPVIRRVLRASIITSLQQTEDAVNQTMRRLAPTGAGAF